MTLPRMTPDQAEAVGQVHDQLEDLPAPDRALVLVVALEQLLAALPPKARPSLRTMARLKSLAYSTPTPPAVVA